MKLGSHLSEEQKRRLGDALRGRPRSEETKGKISRAMKGEKNHSWGKIHSAASRTKMSEKIRGPKHPNWGKHLSEETKKKIGDSRRGERHWFWGKHLSEEHRRKMSEAKRKEKHPFWGKHLSEEHRRKQGETLRLRGKPISEETRRKLSKAATGKIVSEETRRKLREYGIQHPHHIFRDTTIELKVEEELKRRNLFYNKHVSLCKVAVVDFYLPEFKIVIECDGCYWHNCLIHCPLKHIEARLKDRHKDEVLTSNGFKVFRFWEHEINENVKECIDSIIS